MDRDAAYRGSARPQAIRPADPRRAAWQWPPPVCTRSQIDRYPGDRHYRIEKRGIVMQNTASLSQAQQTRQLSGVVAGLGAAFIAAAVTATMMMSGASPAAAPGQTAAAAGPQCKAIPIMLLVSTTTGGGTIRFREGDYLSPPITLSAVPQTVVFPRPRPLAGQLEEVITVEGNATDLVAVSPVTNRRSVVPKVDGVFAYKATWLPAKTC